MLHKLTIEQRAKLARGWVWCVGHRTDRTRLRVVAIGDVPDDNEGEIYFSRNDDNGYKPSELMPDLDDDATSDGMLRTARSMWQDESLHVVILKSGHRILRRVGTDGRGQKEMQVWYGESFDRPPGDGIPLARVYDSEKEALLAAILAAPEKP